MIIQTIAQRKEKPNFETIEWGTQITDYMLFMDFDGKEWGEIHIVPHGPIEMYPENCTLHYGQSIFEGAKAYRRADNGINIFRHYDNLSRMNKSQKRLLMPTFTNDDKDKLFDGLKTLLKMEADWVPEEKYGSLYIRNFTYATENFIGLRPSKTYRTMIILSPVPPYLNGFTPTKLMIPDKYTRAVKGGAGEAKMSGNYAPTLLAVKEAQMRGYDNCLFLNGNKISECSAANIFFVHDKKVITPKLDGTILDGITRRSIIKLCEQHGFDVREEYITIDTLQYLYNHHRLDEIFITGTAACIIPVSELYYKEETIKPNFEIGPITNLLYDELTDILYSRITDNNCWITKVT